VGAGDHATRATRLDPCRGLDHHPQERPASAVTLGDIEDVDAVEADEQITP
jgi:hypothetical protein